MDAVQQWRISEARRGSHRLWAEVVRNYPQYRLDEVKDMAIGDINLLVNYARLERLEQMAILQQVVLATDESGATQLQNSLKEAINEHQSAL